MQDDDVPLHKSQFLVRAISGRALPGDAPGREYLRQHRSVRSLNACRDQMGPDPHRSRVSAAAAGSLKASAAVLLSEMIFGQGVQVTLEVIREKDQNRQRQCRRPKAAKAAVVVAMTMIISFCLIGLSRRAKHRQIIPRLVLNPSRARLTAWS